MPQPLLIEIAIKPTSKADRQRLDVALSKLAGEDLSFAVSSDQQLGLTILRGVSEFQLDNKLMALRRDHRIEVDVDALHVAYRETLAKRVEIDETHKKLAGSTGQFARVKIIFEPAEPGAGSSFESNIVGGSVPKEYIPGVEKGINSVMGSGILAGFPVVDVKATLIDGAFHDVDSSVLAFEICSRAAFRRALKEGGSVPLEPIMKVEVTTPEDYKGSVSGDLLSRRGQVQGEDMRGTVFTIKATVPLANMFGYVNQLRSFTQGHGTFAMEFSHYAPALPPPDGPYRPAMGMRA